MELPLPLACFAHLRVGCSVTESNVISPLPRGRWRYLLQVQSQYEGLLVWKVVTGLVAFQVFSSSSLSFPGSAWFR